MDRKRTGGGIVRKVKQETARMKQFIIYLTPDLQQELDLWAVDHTMNRGQAVRYIINEYLKGALKNA